MHYFGSFSIPLSIHYFGIFSIPLSISTTTLSKKTLGTPIQKIVGGAAPTFPKFMVGERLG
jgi:hypothetical protein